MCRAFLTKIRKNRTIASQGEKQIPHASEVFRVGFPEPIGRFEHQRSVNSMLIRSQDPDDLREERYKSVILESGIAAYTDHSSAAITMSTGSPITLSKLPEIPEMIRSPDSWIPYAPALSKGFTCEK